jgi:hypothetical protein
MKSVFSLSFQLNFAFYTPFYPNWPRGLEGARKMITQLRSVIPDVRATVEDIFGEGDKVAVRWTFSETYQGGSQARVSQPREADYFCGDQYLPLCRWED